MFPTLEDCAAAIALVENWGFAGQIRMLKELKEFERFIPRGKHIFCNGHCFCVQGTPEAGYTVVMRKKISGIWDWLPVGHYSKIAAERAKQLGIELVQ